MGHRFIGLYLFFESALSMLVILLKIEGIQAFEVCWCGSITNIAPFQRQLPSSRPKPCLGLTRTQLPDHHSRSYISEDCRYTSEDCYTVVRQGPGGSLCGVRTPLPRVCTPCTTERPACCAPPRARDLPHASCLCDCPLSACCAPVLVSASALPLFSAPSISTLPSSSALLT